MAEKTATEKIRELAERQLAEKIEKERRLAEDAAERDREKVEKCLEMIQKNLVYKDIEQLGWGHRYVLATADMFFEDYIKEPKQSWMRGIEFIDAERGDNDYLYYGVFKVNGERYYDMRYLLRKYEKDVASTLDSLRRKMDELNKIRDAYEDAVRVWPEIKKLVSDWNDLSESE